MFDAGESGTEIPRFQEVGLVDVRLPAVHSHAHTEDIDSQWHTGLRRQYSTSPARFGDVKALTPPKLKSKDYTSLETVSKHDTYVTRLKKYTRRQRSGVE